MFSNFSINNMEQIFHSVGSALLQTGTGYLSGHFINAVTQWLHPGKVILGQPPLLAINPLFAIASVGIFVLVDKVAQTAIENSGHKEKFQKPLYQLIRMVFTVTISSLAASVILGITLKIAAAAILCSIIASTILLYAAKLYTKLVYDTPLQIQIQVNS